MRVVYRVAHLGAFGYFTEGYLKEEICVFKPATAHFVVHYEYVIASTIAAILKMNGFFAKLFTCPLEH
jgi:hypothetical protein